MGNGALRGPVFRSVLPGAPGGPGLGCVKIGAGAIAACGAGSGSAAIPGARSRWTGPIGGVSASAIARRTVACALFGSISNEPFTSGRRRAAWSRIWWV